MKRFCLALLILLLLSACGRAEPVPVTTIPTTIRTEPTTEQESVSVIELDAPPFEDALQANFANWRESYLAVLRARWHDHLRQQPDTPGISYYLVDFNKDGVPEMLVWVYVCSDCFADLHLFTFANGKVRSFDRPQFIGLPNEYINKKTGEVKLFVDDYYEDLLYEATLDFNTYRMEAKLIPAEGWADVWEPTWREEHLDDPGDGINDPGWDISADDFNKRADAFERIRG